MEIFPKPGVYARIGYNQGKMMKRILWISLIVILMGVWGQTGCTARPVPEGTPARLAFTATTLPAPAFILPSLTSAPSIQVTRVIPPVASPTPIPPASVWFWMDPVLSREIFMPTNLPDGWAAADSSGQANAGLGLEDGDFQNKVILGRVSRTYVLVTPFSSLVDDVPVNRLKEAWRRRKNSDFYVPPILLDPATLDVFEALWGKAEPSSIKLLPSAEILDYAWTDPSSWAIVPFEDLQPRWKVHSVDGVSPLQKGALLSTYALNANFVLWSKPEVQQRVMAYQADLLPPANRDEGKLTVLLMSGVTALTRATAARMNDMGIHYPARDILDWFKSADIVHISSESSFAKNCPPADPGQPDLRFCSSPKHIDLFSDIGVNLIELTGNHVMDWGADAMLLSLDMFQERNWPVFGGGTNLPAARQPALIESKGGRLAFIGCNPAGPDFAWATATQPGAAPCDDFLWLKEEVARLKKDGYLPIVTFQYYENYNSLASPQMKADFRQMVDAGAVIVQGSQAHTPKEMEFYQGSFIHYGLGNLFFDQMHVYVFNQFIDATRDEFLDRHIFYNGKYISTELYTARLEDYARPRPMTESERQSFLKRIFDLTAW